LFVVDCSKAAWFEVTLRQSPKRKDLQKMLIRLKAQKEMALR
jgi:hypothetical protein